MQKVIHGNCLDVLRRATPNSIDAIVTDPPYGLSFMGKKWDYDVPSVEIWQECLRVLKPGGYLLAFAGTRTQHRMAVRIEDAGFEIRDMIAWVYGSGFPKSLNIGKAVDKLQGNEREVVGDKITGKALQKTSKTGEFADGKHGGQQTITVTKGTSEWEGWGTALKPALEPITMARKPLDEKTVAENCLKWGTGGINIDESRVSCDLDTEDLSRGRQSNGGAIFGSTNKEIKIEANNLGRFPANLIHDGSDEVRECFPEAKGASSQNNYSNGKIYRGQSLLESKTKLEGHRDWYNDNGNASRFFKSIIYQAKASKSERNKGCEELEEKKNVEHRFGRYRCKLCGKLQLDHNPCICDSPDLERIEVNNGNNHPTVKPIALMEYLVKLVSREGALVLDPFAGSGSTLLACKNLGRGYVGIEMDEEYIKIINARLGNTL